MDFGLLGHAAVDVETGGIIPFGAGIAAMEHFLDITADVCPMTFVRTRLLIERMASGDTATIVLRGAEPIENVPASVTELGHRVVEMRPLQDDPGARGPGAGQGHAGRRHGPQDREDIAWPGDIRDLPPTAVRSTTETGSQRIVSASIAPPPSSA